MATTTTERIEALLEQLARYVDQPDRLVLQHGSPTYGRAWRLFVSARAGGQGGLRTFLELDNGYLGWTKTEAACTLSGLIMGIGTTDDIRLGPVDDLP